MATWENFRLSELHLDQQNYRTGNTASQREAIAGIIADQGTKLVNLGEDILSMRGTSPGEPIWVTRDTEAAGFYIVLEGNRRVAALKLMETPALADGTVVEEGFRELGKQYAAAPIRELEACVFPTREDAAPWQRRRHMTSTSGVGLQGWKPMAKGRADRDQGAKAPRFLTVYEYLQDNSDEWAELSDTLDNKWTTVDRVLNASTLASVLGITIDLKTGTITFGNGNVAAGRALLLRILHEMASPSFAFSQIEKDVDREQFIRRFEPWAVLSKATPPSGAPAPIPPASPPPAPAPTPQPAPAPPVALTPPTRQTLAPKTGNRTFRVDGTRLNGLYRECRLLKVQGNENAASFLLRVFIELSSEALLIEKNVPVSGAATKRGATVWEDFGATLAMKVGAVIDHLDPTGKDRRLQQARVARDPNSAATYSISTLHAYFHNRHMKPDAVAIREAWDAWEDYLRLLHAARV
jgi:hypothetical protein